MSAKLYHFTGIGFHTAIRREGITRGVTPITVCNQLGFLAQQQWLTTNKSFNQEWEKGSSLPYNRNDVRFQIKIPKNFQDNLISMGDLIDRFGNYLLEDFFYDDNSMKEWFVYLGSIPLLWIKDEKWNNATTKGQS